MSHRATLLLISYLTGLGLTVRPAQSTAIVQMPSLAQTAIAQTAPSTNAYDEAIALAQQAVARGKTAQAPDEWADIADQWQRAAELMESVPTESDRYATAQEKAANYRQNSEIASQEEEKRRSQASLTSLLGPGSNGSQVRELQEGLKKLGHFDSEVNGVYDENTLRAVSAFQTAQGLEPDGLVGRTTWERFQTARSPIVTASSNTSSASSPKPNPQRNWVRWVLIALVLLTATGGVILILLKLLAQRNTEVYEDLEAEINAAQADESTYSRPEPADPTYTNSASPDSDGNGHSLSFAKAPEEPPPPPEPPPPAAPPPAPASETLVVGETTRLAKVNIIDELIQDLESPDRSKRSKAIWELGQRGSSQAAQPLVNLLIDSDSQQRSLILAALSEIGIRTLKPMNRALAISLQDDNPEVRKNAIRDLTRMYELMANVSQLMRYAVEDPDREVQETAKWALNQLNRLRPPANFDSSWQDSEE